MSDLKPPIYVARNRATGDLLLEHGDVVQGVYTWVASALQGLVSDANREAFDLVRKDDVEFAFAGSHMGTKLKLAGQMRQSVLTEFEDAWGNRIPNEPPAQTDAEPEEASSPVIDTDEGSTLVGLTREETVYVLGQKRDNPADPTLDFEPAEEGGNDPVDQPILHKYHTVLATLDRIGAPTHDEAGRRLNANGRLEDWLEAHGYHPDASGSARARRDGDDNAFRLTARLRAILDDYETDKVTYEELVKYVRRTSTSFDS